MTTLQQVLNRVMDSLHGPHGSDGPTEPRDSFGLGTLLAALDWERVRDEVDREARAQIVIVGGPESDKRALLQWLHGVQTTANKSPADTAPEASEATDPETDFADFGLFALATLPDEHGPTDLQQWPSLDSANLLVYLLDADTVTHDNNQAWLARLRATGRALLVAVDTRHAPEPELLQEKFGHRLAQPWVQINTQSGANIIEAMLPMMVTVCPTLNTALGREVPVWRQQAIRRTLERSAWLSGLAGVEPVPLLDLPFQMLIQLRLVLRIAAAYGEPVNDRYSRELLAALLGSAGLRYASQQITKLVPVVGWLASGALAASGTWAMGRLATTYFENGRRLPLPQMRKPTLKPNTLGTTPIKRRLRWRRSHE